MDLSPRDLHYPQRLLRRWSLISLGELLLSLGLAAIAPTLLNSNYPILGLLLWLGILGMLGGSAAIALSRLWHASRARRIFLQRFPDYRSLGVLHFVGLSAPRVATQLHLWDQAQTDPQFHSLDISPFEFLRGARQ